MYISWVWTQNTLLGVWKSSISAVCILFYIFPQLLEAAGQSHSAWAKFPEQHNILTVLLPPPLMVHLFWNDKIWLLLTHLCMRRRCNTVFYWKIILACKSISISHESSIPFYFRFIFRYSIFITSFCFKDWNSPDALHNDKLVVIGNIAFDGREWV